MTYIEKGLKLITQINEYGYEAYIIGGAVRDYLLNQEIHDIDIATNMPLEQLASLHKDILSTNSDDYLSITIKIDNDRFEITHFRKDISYEDHRHPKVLLVDTLKEDVQRRDFTINALAMDKDKKIYDYFHGLDDLRLGVIKTIGDPYKRFEEDSLRILRACHYAGKLGFCIEKNTLEAMALKKDLLVYLSNERLYQYFIQIFYAPTDKGIMYCKDNHLFSAVTPFDLWTKIWQHNYQKEYVGVYYYLHYHLFAPIVSVVEKKLIKIISILEENSFEPYYLYKYSSYMRDLISIYDTYKGMKYLCDKYQELNIKSEKDLAIPMKEIISFVSGKNKSNIIKNLLCGILDGTVENNREQIIKYLESMSD